jgi:hypothetical protein
VTKVEGIVFNTNSSRSQKMNGYYQYWEKEIFNTLSKMIIRNLTNFNQSLQNSHDPLFMIETNLSVPDISLYPTPNEMAKLFLQCIRDCVER